MAPRIDLSHSTHSKVMVIPPRMNLRRATSYNHSERGPVSSTSSRFNFNHLLFSPPPSPSLPALVPTHRRRSSSNRFVTRPSRVVRSAIYFTTFLVTLYVLVISFRHGQIMPNAASHLSDEEYELVGQDSVPDFPTPIVVSEKDKSSKWTVSIPRGHDFPLSMDEYAGMTGQCREVSARTRDLHRKTSISDQALLASVKSDQYFVDVEDAEKMGLLPSSQGSVPSNHSGHFAGLNWDVTVGKAVCEKTLTFVLETPEAGIGSSLMAMWTLYALAKEQGRAFFLEDSRWAYGSFTEVFQSPPAPDCRPPPRHQMLPCPVQARHLVVSRVTIKDTLPALLAQHRRLAGSDGGPRDLMNLARTGYQALFKLVKDDQKYVDKRVQALKSKAATTASDSPNAPIIGIHVRHGDRHPLEYQYKDGYIPAEVFVGSVQRQVQAHYDRLKTEAAHDRVVTIIASDDPRVHEEPEFSTAFVAQERIRLATKNAVADLSENPHILHQFVEEAFGWDGGFFAPIFWNLGKKSKNAASRADGMSNEPPSEEARRLRSLMARAYMMDLEVLTQASDKIVCAVSAMGCRILGVMMGWERAITGGDWVNVDGGYGWGGLEW